MNTLTKEQADLLRSIRKLGGFAENQVQLLNKKLSDSKCPHEPEVDADPKNCPVCSLLKPIIAACEHMENFNKELDAHLVRGPEVS